MPGPTREWEDDVEDDVQAVADMLTGLESMDSDLAPRMQRRLFLTRLIEELDKELEAMGPESED